MERTQDYYRHQEQRVVANRNEFNNLFAIRKDWEVHDSRYAKRHPFDCGRPGCLWCHSEKELEHRRFTLSPKELNQLLEEEDMVL